eukprot:TRINITY_DN15405_c0_g1_i1.p1 TRINITY_DN15405_c0_g1~~TRINITY_DN15405_c0_g1_i1.p1  ORF type:complete len:55 (-),score=7.85 TRINITY_DN15405_c0_g1_i1:192-356(-)
MLQFYVNYEMKELQKRMDHHRCNKENYPKLVEDRLITALWCLRQTLMRTLLTFA